MFDRILITVLSVSLAISIGACSSLVKDGIYYSKFGDVVTISTRSPAAFTLKDNRGRCVMFWSKLNQNNPVEFYGSSCDENRSESSRNSQHEWKSEIISSSKNLMSIKHLGKEVYVIERQT